MATASGRPTAPSRSIDPAAVPHRILYTGARMPAVGLGTFGSDHVTPAQVAEAVLGAAALGYRHFDCASVYGNEPAVGASFRQILASGLTRDQLWITSKLWNDKHAPEDVLASCRQSLSDLGLDYLDMFLVHWPFPNFHAPGCDVSSRSADAQPYIHENFMRTWRAMEQLVELGLTRHIGTSNVTIPKLKLILRDARIRPAVNEMELHPHFQQPELFRFVLDNGMQPIGFCPIGSPGRPRRDRTPDDTSPTDDPVIRDLAARHSISPAEVCIKWAVQRGQTPIPFSLHHYRENLACILTAPLNEQEMQAIAAIDKKCRLIKGQVFLWKENQNWEDLWDVNGTITPE